MSILGDLGRRPLTAAGLAIGAVVVFRLILVIASPLEIGPDEAQYWRWSRTLDFGYYSKPPLIAWAISISTAVLGNSEWAIRFLAPILHGVSAFVLFLLGRRMFDARIGGWAAAIYLMMPGIWLSSTIMSTDAVLLPVWSAALYFLWRFRETPGYGLAIAAGTMIGLGVLAKYSAVYLYGGAALAALVDRDMRKALVSPQGAALGAASLLVMSPNLIWNIANDFATVSHTADNANLAEAGFNPLNVLGFVADQAAVFGPVMILFLLAGFALILGRKDKWTASREVWLLCFIAPALLVTMGQEVMSRAHANWAAVAYPGASVLAASWIDRVFGRPTSRFKAGPVIKAGVGVNVVFGLLFAALWVSPSLADATGASNGMKGVRGWKQTVAELGVYAKDLNATAIMVDDREYWHGLDYYGRNSGLPPIRAWQRGPTPRSHAEEAGMMQPGEDARVLVASGLAYFRPMIRADFAAVQEVGYITVPIGPDRIRKLKLFLASGYKQAPRTPEFEAKHAYLEEE